MAETNKGLRNAKMKHTEKEDGNDTANATKLTHAYPQGMMHASKKHTMKPIMESRKKREKKATAGGAPGKNKPKKKTEGERTGPRGMKCKGHWV